MRWMDKGAWRRAMAGAALLGVLAGCVTTKINLEHKMVEQAPFDDPVATVDDALTFTSTTPESGLRLRRLVGHGALSAPAVERYLNGVLAKLISALPRPGPKATVYLVPDDELSAETNIGGAIFVSPTLLKYFESEDEIAFLLAHEYGHVLFRHAARGSIADWVDRADNIFKTALTVWSELHGDDVQLAILKSEVLYQGATSILLPSWNREQEEVADLFAIDLVLLAGYNLEGGMGFFEVLKGIDDERKRRRAIERELLARNQEQNFSKLMAFDFQEVKDRLRSAHDDADERKKVALKYIDTHYLEHEIPKPRVTQWTRVRDGSAMRNALNLVELGSKYAQASMGGNTASTGSPTRYGKNGAVLTIAALNERKRGKKAEAINLLRQAERVDGHPLLTYGTRVRLESAGGDFDAAREAISAAEAEFGETQYLLPMRIELARASDNKVERLKYLTACHATDSRLLRELCDAAARGEKPE